MTRRTGYVLALHMNLVPTAACGSSPETGCQDRGNNGLLATGFLTLSVYNPPGAGHDLWFTTLLNTQYPSWGYLIEHATTMERWNGDQMKDDPSMNSITTTHTARWPTGSIATPRVMRCRTRVPHGRTASRI